MYIFDIPAAAIERRAIPSYNARMPGLQEDRYDRQRRLPQLGDAGQTRLGAARVLVVGCGALGTVLAEQLARAGVGFLRIVDRDLVELTNLHRQVLFDESDAARAAPKAVAAAERLACINGSVQIDPLVMDVHAGNVESLLETSAGRIDLILDGSDNVEARYLLNDVSAKHRLPWVYGACVGVEGRVMSVTPAGACLRCVFPNPPAPGELPTCDVAGVLGPAVAVVASLQASAEVRFLVDNSTHQKLITIDAWAGRFREIDLTSARRPDCPCCALRRFDFLDAPPAGHVSLCGSNAVQIRPTGASINLQDLEARLATVGPTERTRFLVRCQVDANRSLTLTVFPDGRAIVTGTRDPAVARAVYARWIGS